MGVKHILMVLEHDFPEDERVEKQALSLLHANYKVTVLCATQNKIFSHNTTYKGINIIKKYLPKFHYKSSVAALTLPFYFWFWKKYLNEIFAKQTFSAIHLHDLPLAKPVYQLATVNNIPLVLDLHENWAALLQMSQHTQTLLGKILSRHKQWVAYEKNYVNKADYVIVVVNEAKQRLVSLGCTAKKITVVSNVIAIPKTAAIPQIHRPHSLKNITLVYAGSVTYHRGLQYVLQAMANCTDVSLHLKIIGNGRYINSLKTLAKTLSIQDKITFYGHLNYDSMMEEIKSAHIGLIPHIPSAHTNATIPNKLFQYMYLKKPVLASNCKPLQRIVLSTQSGACFTYNNTTSFLKQLHLIIQNTDTYSDYAMNGAKAVKHIYNWGIEEKKLTALYHKLSYKKD